MENKILYEYAHVDDNKNISIINNIETKNLNMEHIYIDKNCFDMILADSINKEFYKIYNIYSIEDGKIYVIGFYSELYTESNGKINKMKRPLINAWINYQQNKKGEKYIKEVVFNPNRFFQFDSSVFINWNDMKLLKKLTKNTPTYDQPWNNIQKIIYLQGIKDGLKNKVSLMEINELRQKVFKKELSPYFSFENFYLDGLTVPLYGGFDNASK